MLLISGCEITTSPDEDAEGPDSPLELILDCSNTGRQPSGALFMICLPEMWNRDVVIYAHGYVPLDEKLELPGEALIFRELFGQLKYGFATTSYRINGLSVKEGVLDLVELAQIIKRDYPEVENILVGGVSEGGLITTLAIERYPELFSGGLATCGPYGDFQNQIEYFGDLRTVFNYFFPEVLPGNIVDYPEDVVLNWEETYVPRIKVALTERPDATRKLIQTLKIPVDQADTSFTNNTIVDILWYGVFAARDARVKLNGNPYGNIETRYSGSEDDELLNEGVERFQADAGAVAEIETFYRTTGVLSRPLITLHTTGDPIIPVTQQWLYQQKILSAGSNLQYGGLSIPRYGHCNFDPEEIRAAFALLVQKSTGETLEIPDALSGIPYQARVHRDVD